jgi:hypothetical protein
MRALLIHWPHVVPVLLGFGGVVYLWVANRRWHAGRREPPRREVASGVRREAARRGASPAVAGESASGVRHEAARRGALVLGPIFASIATGVAIYAVRLTAGHPGGWLVWGHVGVALLVCALAAYKLVDVEAARLRRVWRAGGALEVGGGVLLGVLLLPLLASGIVVLASPSGGSYWANLHLIASAWWTLLVGWHLARYLIRSMRALRAHPPVSRARRTPPYRSPQVSRRRGWVGGPALRRRRYRDSRP